MMTMTGLERIAPSQSKFVNISALLGGSGGTTRFSAGGGTGQLRHPVLRGRDQLPVLRVVDDVAVSLDRAGELAARLVQRGQARERREPVGLVQVRAAARDGVRFHRAGHVLELLAA